MIARSVLAACQFSLAAELPAIHWLLCFPRFAAGVQCRHHKQTAVDCRRHVPAGTLDLLGEEISRIAAKSEGKLIFGFLLGLGVALWSAKAGIKANLRCPQHHI
jgi:uncharacterized BrkB/YihY/UPF0761 family membrane protein